MCHKIPLNLRERLPSILSSFSPALFLSSSGPAMAFLPPPLSPSSPSSLFALSSRFNPVLTGFFWFSPVLSGFLYFSSSSSVWFYGVLSDPHRDQASSVLAGALWCAHGLCLLLPPSLGCLFLSPSLSRSLSLPLFVSDQWLVMEVNGSEEGWRSRPDTVPLWRTAGPEDMWSRGRGSRSQGVWQSGEGRGGGG